MVFATLSVLASALPVAYRWRWRLLIAATGLLLGYGIL